MLILSRKKAEVVVIEDLDNGETIEITLVEIQPSRIRIGFKASDRFKILRKELVDNIKT